MLIKQIDVKEVQARWQELMAQIAAGVEWVLMDGAKPVARLLPMSKRVAGLHGGKVWMSADFDEPLPDAIWSGEA